MCVCACLFEGVCVRVYMCDPNKPIACKAQDYFYDFYDDFYGYYLWNPF